MLKVNYIQLLIEARNSLRRMDAGWCSLHDMPQLSDEEFDDLLGRLEEAVGDYIAHSVANPKCDALYWYDRSLRLWVITKRDSEGYQIEDVIYATSKQEAIEIAHKGW